MTLNKHFQSGNQWVTLQAVVLSREAARNLGYDDFQVYWGNDGDVRNITPAIKALGLLEGLVDAHDWEQEFVETQIDEFEQRKNANI